MLKKYFFYILIISGTFSACKKDPAPPPGDNNDTNNNTTTPLPTNLPDGNFEQWALSAQSTFEEPASGWWTTLNVLKNLGGPETVFKVSDKNTGAYAAKLVTGMWNDLLIPGLLISGTFDFNAPNMVIQGKPFTEKALKLKGYYKYTSVNGDSAAIYANLTLYNTQSLMRDTVAEVRFPVLNTVTAYTYFEMDFNYLLTGINPDSLTLVFSSSADGANFNGQAGSTLFVDDISLVLPGNKKYTVSF